MMSPSLLLLVFTVWIPSHGQALDAKDFPLEDSSATTVALKSILQEEPFRNSNSLTSFYRVTELILYSRAKLPKCCLKTEVLDFSTQRCCPYEGNASLSEHPIEALIETLDQLPTSFEVSESHGFPSCDQEQQETVILTNKVDSLEFVIDHTSEDVLLLPFDADEPHQQFCIDRDGTCFNSFYGGVRNFVLFALQDDVRRGDYRCKGLSAHVCRLKPDILCRLHPCVRMCCPLGYVYDEVHRICITTNSTIAWKPQLYDLEDKPVTGSLDDVIYFYGSPPDCTRTGVYIKYDTMAIIDRVTEVTQSAYADAIPSVFHLKENGKMKIGDRYLSQSQYCIAPSANGHEIAHACEPLNTPDAYSILDALILSILPTLLGLSVVFLVISFVLVLRRKNTKLFRVMTLCMLAMLTGFYLGLFIPYVSNGLGGVRVSSTLCIVEGLAIQYSYLSALCWLNCMSYTIWNSFRKIRHNAAPEANKAWKHPRLIKYALWAWGFPAALSIFTITMQFLPEDMTQGLITPQIGRTKCFLEDGASTFFFFHLFTGPCLLFNLAGFICTSWNLCCGIWADGNTRQDSPGRTMKAQQRSKLVTLVKMFFAMGISWLAEFISWLLGWRYGRQGWVGGISFVFDLINASQGIILFMVLFFNRGTINKTTTYINQARSKILGDKPKATIQDSYRIRSDSEASDFQADPTLTSYLDTTTSTETPSSMSSMLATLASPLKKSRANYNVRAVELAAFRQTP